MLNLMGIANGKKFRNHKVDNSYNKKFSTARLNLELINQENKFGSTKELAESLMAL